MASKLLYEKMAPETQSTESVVALLKFLGREYDPIPAVVKFADMALVLNAKADAYYVVTPDDCSCPSRVYRPEQTCKHMRKHFPTCPTPRSMADALSEESIKPTGKWAGGNNGPVPVDGGI